jgi:hypothetical protein
LNSRLGAPKSEDGLFIDESFSIDFYALTDDGAKPITDIIIALDKLTLAVLASLLSG